MHSKNVLFQCFHFIPIENTRKVKVWVNRTIGNQALYQRNAKILKRSERKDCVFLEIALFDCLNIKSSREKNFTYMNHCENSNLIISF